jgi:hypothetical protein
MSHPKFSEAQVKRLHEEKLRELAADPKNIVYRYVDRERLQEQVPLEIVEQNIKDLWKVSCQLTETNAAKRRQDVCEISERWLKFSETHPTFFDRIVHPDTTHQQIEAMLMMINMHRRTHGSQEGKQEFEKHLWNAFSVPEDVYKKQYPGAEIRNI